MVIYKALIRAEVTRLFGAEYRINLSVRDNCLVVYLHEEHYGKTPEEPIPLCEFTQDAAKNTERIIATINSINENMLPF